MSQMQPTGGIRGRIRQVLSSLAWSGVSSQSRCRCDLGEPVRWCSPCGRCRLACLPT